MPESSGPSVTKLVPSGLQSSQPPTSGTRSTTRDAATARCSASSASRTRRPSPVGVRVDRFECEQHRPLGIGLQVRDRGRRELARDRDSALRVGAVRAGRPRTKPSTSETTKPAAIPATRSRRRRLVRACRSTRCASARRSSSRGSGSRRGTRVRPVGSCLDAVVHDVDDVLETCAAIQRAGITIELDPARGRLTQLAERDDRLAVVVDPASQPRPFA